MNCPAHGFVGRQREMEELQASLAEASSARGRLIMLVGEPGIGKTRTAQELAAYAEAQGFRVWWGRCYEGEGAPAYWPWLQPLRAYVQQTDPDLLRQRMGPGAADLAEIVPELRSKLPDLEPPPTLEPEQARFRLFDSITTFLKTLASDQPTMLVLDDLHWADRSSLLLLLFLARQLEGSPLLVVGTYRDLEISRQHPLSETLAQLAREPVYRRQALRGLSHEDTGWFIKAFFGLEPEQSLVETIYSHTEGNPFFMREVVHLLSEPEGNGGSQLSGRTGLSIPEGVREVLGQRLNRLSPECYRVLTTASIIGREFSLNQLSLLAEGLSEDRLLDVVEEALAARVVEEGAETGAGYQFTHALIQETLVSELSSARRMRLHGRVGEALEELYGEASGDHAAELAFHFGAAEPVLGPTKLVRYSSLAGEQALATYAWEEAVEHLQRGLKIKEGHPPDAETAALLAALGRAQLATLPIHQAHEAVDTLSRAFDYYAQQGEVARAVAVAGQSMPPSGSTPYTGISRLIARALELVPPDSLQAGKLQSSYIRARSAEEGYYQGAQEALDRVLDIARREGDVTLEIQTLADAANVAFLQRRFPETLGKSLAAIELAREGDNSHAQLTARWLAAATLLRSVGDLESARRHAQAMLPLAEQLRDRVSLAIAAWTNHNVHRLVGNWSTARDFSDRGLAASPHDLRLLAYRVCLEHEVGQFETGEVFLARLLEIMGSMIPAGQRWIDGGASVAWVEPLLACITGQDQGPQFLAAAEEFLTSPRSTPNNAVTARTGLALQAVLENNQQAAGELYSALCSEKGTLLTSYIMAGDRLLGLLCQTTGNLAAAAEHFEDSLGFCRNAGYRPELAWTCQDYAGTLLRRDASGDHARALTLLDEALAISEELGMLPLRDRVATLQQQAQSRPGRAPAFPDGLSQREVEVLRLLAAGKTDREIAQELIISSRTVGTHVSNILNKTGAANRTEAASYATRHGLDSPS